YYIGRMAVAKDHRHQQLGTVILEAAEAAIKKLGVKKIMLSAQVRAQNFYLRNGYTGDPKEVHMDEGEPHRWLYKKI
ncbi:MAG: GNAT family N-acetyltransferase, partial [Negativicoccus succinicivorans]|nr:GNAT family N-acetyltransferase [Negativicoccus succinicivorans]